jgi:hypothetical protein
MPATNEKLEVRLTPETRTELAAFVRKGDSPAAKVRRARILLLSDRDHVDGRRTDGTIAEIVGLSERQVCRIRQAFVREGSVAAAVERKARSAPGTRPIFDGRSEAKLVLLACSTPPHGRKAWTMQLLADEAMRLSIVTKVSEETVRQTLKKTGCSLGGRSAFASRRRISPASSPRWSDCSTSTPSRSTTGTF